METNKKELNENEMEQVNGAGLLEWVETNVALPVYKELKGVSENLVEKVSDLKDTVDDKIQEVIRDVTNK